METTINTEDRKLTDTIKQIGKSTTLSVALVISLVTTAYHAGQQTQRIDTLESEQDKTTDVLRTLRTLAETMDKRLQILEDRDARQGMPSYPYGTKRRTEQEGQRPMAYHVARGSGGGDRMQRLRAMQGCGRGSLCGPVSGPAVDPRAWQIPAPHC